MGFRLDGPSKARSFHSTMASGRLDFGCVRVCCIVSTCRIAFRAIFADIKIGITMHHETKQELRTPP